VLKKENNATRCKERSENQTGMEQTKGEAKMSHDTTVTTLQNSTGKCLWLNDNGSM